MSLIWPNKDPDAVLDYKLVWTSWLNGDTIATSSWTVPTGITEDSNTNDDTSTTIWLSGGTAGVRYELKNTITTVAGRTDERTVIIVAREK